MKERLSLAVMAYMTAQLALDEALNYVKEREAFGRPIGKYQVIRHKLVDMATEVEIAREFTYRVAARMQANQTPIKEIAMAKNFATDVAERTTREAVQIFGGMGYMQGTVVERLYRDAKILSIGGGTTEIMKEMIAKQMKL
jgi:acyl-CoA dehydrogenase